MSLSTAVDLDLVERLRRQVASIESASAGGEVATHPVLGDLLRLRAGAVYGVDSASLALALMAGVSAAGEWTGVVGWGDLGLQAATDLGVDLARTALVPDPGEHWLEVTAALVDVMRLVVLRPTTRIEQGTASRLQARLRKRSAVLVVWGAWPGCEARLAVEQARWSGPDQGEGRLRARQASIAVRRGAAPPRRRSVAFPSDPQVVEPVPPVVESAPSVVESAPSVVEPVETPFRVVSR